MRGCLALVVVVFHATEGTGLTWFLMPASRLAVGGFFVLSGWVLARGWDGRVGVFLARRFLRLWPTFAVCLAAGSVLLNIPVAPWRMFWFPLASPYQGAEADRPAWSLFIEAWAMPAMPAFAWAARGSPVRVAVLAACLFFAGMLWRPEWLYGLLFLGGACLHRVRWRCSGLEGPAVQWLGTISYSLYLTHWIVLQALPLPVAVMMIPLAASMVYALVERPSLVLARAVGRRSRFAGATAKG